MRTRQQGLLRTPLAIGLLLAIAVGGSVAAAAHSKKASSKLATAGSTPTAADAGVSFVPQSAPASAASSAQTQAISVASDSVGATATAPGVQVSVAYGLFTDSQYTGPLPSGGQAPLYAGRPVWLVTFSGVDLTPTMSGPSANHEINVAVDAATGQYLEAYSFR